MRRSSLTRQRLMALFGLGVFLLFSPLIALFDRSVALFGMPLLYVYLFGVWAVLIALSAWILRPGAE